jgi:hypothetical protein
MKSLRRQLKAAVLAALPALAPGCTSSLSGADAGAPVFDSGPRLGGGSTGTNPSNICTACVAAGMECNFYGTGCQPPCTDCACATEVEPVDALDGGYPDGGLPLELCRAVCPDPVGNVWSCGVVDGGCDPAELGALCIHCLVEGCSGVGGRCPEGLQPPELPMTTVQAGSSPLAVFLVCAAHLEAASVHAFRRMARELEGFGAPRAFVLQARKAARQEAVHARRMRALARRQGGLPIRVHLAPFQPRGLEAFAVENAVEGTVRETVGAALALWQSLRAADPELRQVMTDIFEDEAEHAELAWEVDAWARSQLSRPEQARVAAARRRSAKAWEEMAFPEEVSLRAGLPSAIDGRRLFSELHARFWVD